MTGALEMEVQPADHERAVATKLLLLLQTSDAARQGRREYSKEQEHQSPRAGYIKHADLLSRKLARYIILYSSHTYIFRLDHHKIACFVLLRVV